MIIFFSGFLSSKWSRELSSCWTDDEHGSIASLQNMLCPDTGHLSSSLLSSVRVWLQDCIKALLYKSQLMD